MGITYGGCDFSSVLEDDRAFRCLSNFAVQVFCRRTILSGGGFRTLWTLGRELFSQLFLGLFRRVFVFSSCV